MVHLFDSLVRTIPDGVILTSIKQEGDKLTLEGRSQSNARVSTYMRNLEGSGWMTKPDLSIIEAKAGDPGLAVRVHAERACWPIRTRRRTRTATACRMRRPRRSPAPRRRDRAGRGHTPAATPRPQPAATAAAAPPRRPQRPATRRSRAVKKKMSLKDLNFNNTGSLAARVQDRVLRARRPADLRPGCGGCSCATSARSSKAWSARKPTCATEFETKQGRAANLEPLKLQLAQMEQQLQQMLRQLPSKTEMPDLIVDISQTALATGISNELFQPGPETPKEFYAEKPISLRMVGTYHQFGAFVSGVASLPRVVILTMHDISLKPRNPRKGGRSDRTRRWSSPARSRPTVTWTKKKPRAQEEGRRRHRPPQGGTLTCASGLACA